MTLTAKGGDTYRWSNGATTKSIIVGPLESKIFSVTVYKNGCEDSDSVQVSIKQNDVVNNSPAKANAGEDITICIGESVNLHAEGGNSYIWNTGDTDKDIIVSPKRTTMYTLKATKGGVTDSDTVIVTVENCKNELTKGELDNNFKVFPNPSTGILNVNISNLNNDLNLILINLNGSIVFTDKVNSIKGGYTKQIDLSGFAKGVYFVRLFNSNQNMIKKILLI